jgi:transcription elongation factor Elf1
MKYNRTAEKNCPMCGSENETLSDYCMDNDYLSVKCHCNNCGLDYELYYHLTYDGFGCGQVTWNSSGEMDDDDNI